MANGCIARFDTSLSGAEVAAHYEREFAAHGWQPVPAGPDTVATKNGIWVRVESYDRVRRAGTLVIVTVGEQ